MKHIRKILFLSLALFCSSSLFAKGEQYLVSGSGWDKVAIIDSETKRPVWVASLPEGGECNSVVYTKNGAVAFSYSRGAQMVDMTGRVLWDYKVDEGEEVQSIVEHKGKFILGVCGNPSSIVVLDRFGGEKSVIEFETGIKQPHAQFRQIRVASNGNYLIPLLNGKVMELNEEGECVKTYEVGGGLFSLTQLPDGKWLVPQGDAHSFVEYDPQKGEVVKKYTSEDVGIKLGFVAQVVRYKDGNTLVCNWLRHGGDKTQPMLFLLDAQNNVVWSVDKSDKGIGDISAVEPVGGKFFK